MYSVYNQRFLPLPKVKHEMDTGAQVTVTTTRTTFTCTEGSVHFGWIFVAGTGILTVYLLSHWCAWYLVCLFRSGILWLSRSSVRNC